MKKEFQEVKVLDNFYQTSSFYPMPTVMVTTVSDSGLTNVGAYSLCFPFGIADEHYMMLISRADSNTSFNLQKNKYCALNFIPYNRKFLKNTVYLGYPGETTEAKLKECKYTLKKSLRTVQDKNTEYPEVIEESVQIFECTWIDDSSKFHYGNDGAEKHFLLRIDNIFMQDKWAKALRKGKGFPSLPVDYGYRDGKHFWFAKHSSPYAEPIPKNKGIDANTIKYEVQRMPYDLEWEEEAYAKLVKIPRIFLKRVLISISDRAVSEGVTKITPEILDKYNQKRR